MCLARAHRSGCEIRTTEWSPLSGKLNSQMSNWAFIPALGRTGQQGSVPFISLASERTSKIFEQAAGGEHFADRPLAFLHRHENNAPVRIIVPGKHLTMFSPA